MYITVNGSTYQNAVRVRTAQSVSYTADGLEGIGAVSGVITRYRDDGFEVGSENAADYLRQEAIPGGFRLTNVPEVQPIEPQAEAVVYNEAVSVLCAVKMMMAAGSVPAETDEERITVSGLYADWEYGKHTVGEIYNANGQTWECFQAYDNAVYPDIVPGNSAWYTFNRPLHGKSKETAREFVQPMGSHDMYKSGEWMIFEKKFWMCKSDTAYSPKDYAAAWEDKGVDGNSADAPDNPAVSVPEFVQPTGSNDAYKKGDKVSFENKVYESTIDNNVWSPTAYPAGWKEIER